MRSKNSKNKRQVVTILSLCLVLVLSGIGYLAASKYQKSKEKTDDTEETEEIELYSMQSEDITKLRFVNASQEMTLIKEGEVWKDESDKNFPVNQEYVEVMLEDVAAMTAAKLVVEAPEDLGQYELEKPNYTIELTDKEGESKLLAIGMESAAAEGCYAYVDQPDRIYTVASKITDDFDYTRNQMMELPETPQITAQYVTSFALKAAKGKGFVAKYDAEKAEFSDVDGWDILEAYTSTVPGAQDALQGLFGGLGNMAPVEGVAYHSTEKLLKQYALDDPAWVLDVDYYTVEGEAAADSAEATPAPSAEPKKTEHHYQISVGAMNDTEEYYFVTLGGSDGIYLMSVDTIDALVKINAFDYVSRKMHNPQIESLQSIRFGAGKKHEIKVTKKEVENGISEDGSPVYDYTILLDGTELDENAFITDYTSIFNNLVYSRELPAEKAHNSVRATMQIVTDKRTTELTFLPYDGKNFYEVRTDHGGGAYSFLADINVVDKAMEQLLEIKTAEEAKAEKAEEEKAEAKEKKAEGTEEE